jgi:3',5'-cyclic AMP phosphodiesterase CpdA
MKAYAMKIVQVTDTHLVGPGQSIYGIDPRARLDACFADINARHGDAAFCVLSGDLTDSGEAAPTASCATRSRRSACHTT